MRARQEADLIIVGAGASGMAAAVAAAEYNQASSKPLRIFILEKEAKCGRKISASGNGRCNLGNAHAAPAFYRTSRSDLLPSLMQNFFKYTENLWGELGVFTYLDEEGRVYPQSEESRSINLAFQDALTRHKVQLELNEEVVMIEPLDPGFIVKTREQEYFSKYLIWAGGSPAYPQLSGVHSYRIPSESLSLKTQPFRPALSKLLVREKAFIERAEGSRVKALAYLSSGEQIRGEFLFNKGCLSGIAAMDVSNYLAEREGEWLIGEREDNYHLSTAADIILDLIPSIEKAELSRLLRKKSKRLNCEDLTSLLLSLLPQNVIFAIIQDLREKPEFFKQSFAQQIAELVHLLKHYPFTVYAIRGFRTGQVAVGGIDLSEIEHDFRLKKNKSLYICGEAVDVAGACGGFNLHFAFASGYAAGRSVAQAWQKDS